MKCPKGSMKHRVSKPHGSHTHGASLNPYTHSLKGHTWVGHGSNRVCANCDCKPRHMRVNEV